MPAILRAALVQTIATMDNATARTASYNGTAFDTIDYDGTIKVITHAGLPAGTTETLDLKIQESDTSGGTYTDISGATAAQITTTAASREINVDVSASKRFIRVVGTIAGTSPSYTVSSIAVGSKKYQ